MVLSFNDDMGLNFLEIDEVHGIFRRLGYQREFIKTMVKKATVSYNWRYLIYVFIHCLSARKGGFDEMTFSLSTGYAALISRRQFNFSGFIFNNLKRNIEDSKIKFLLYPRFIQMILNSEIQGLMPEGDACEFNYMTWKVFGNMKKIHPKSSFDGTYTPLCTDGFDLISNLLSGFSGNFSHILAGYFDSYLQRS